MKEKNIRITTTKTVTTAARDNVPCKTSFGKTTTTNQNVTL